MASAGNEEKDNIPKRVGDYIVLQTLGQGSFGKVKLATNLKNNEKVSYRLTVLRWFLSELLATRECLWRGTIPDRDICAVTCLVDVVGCFMFTRVFCRFASRMLFLHFLVSVSVFVFAGRFEVCGQGTDLRYL